ncbi:MAG TPA: universal stress protein [Solirubrobacterales bacterium]|nr:universal stress protein [Solirubrobacterales bacterium]
MAERMPREAALRRVHGTGALFSAAYGNVGSSIYYALGLVALFALGLTPVTFMIAGLIFAFTAASYAEATVLHPEAGGSSSFARQAFNEMASFLAAWSQMLTYIVTIAISAYFIPHYLEAIWEPLGDRPLDVFVAIGIVGALALLNIRGAEESTKINFFLAIADIVTSVLLIGVGFVMVFDPDLLVSQIDLGVAPTWGDFLLGIAVGMVAYTGIETISNMAEEARDASRTVPSGIAWVVIVVVVLYSLLPLIALSAMPVTLGADGTYSTELGTTYKDNPVLGIVENLGLGAALTDALRVAVGALAGVILLIATNAALIGVSRVTFSMGQYRQLPEVLRQLHPRYKTPYVAILTFGAIASLTLFPGQTAFLGTLYAFGATLSFTVAHVSVIRLRKLQPLAERPRNRDGTELWRPPGNVRIRGVDVPPTAIIGGLGTLGAFIVAMVLDPVVLATGGGWMVLGTLGYVAYRRKQGLPLTTTVKVKHLEPLGVEEPEYRSIVVAFEDDPFNEETVAMAKALAANRRRAIHVISLVTVPTHMPLDAELDGAESTAQAKIEQAKLICGQRVTGSLVRVRPGQGAAAIVKGAKELGAAAIVMQLRYRAGAPVYSKTLQAVMAKRPCRVLVTASPEAAREGIVPSLSA